MTAKKCQIKISSNADGEFDNFESEGEIELANDKEVISFTRDADCCKIELNESGVKYFRKGSVCLELEFKENSKTQGRLIYGNDVGKFDIQTEELNLIKGKSGVKIHLEYTCAQESITLNITAVYIREKK